MIKVKSVLEAIFMNNRKGLKNEKVSMRKNSVQYMSEMENIYFRKHYKKWTIGIIVTLVLEFVINYILSMLIEIF